MEPIYDRGNTSRPRFSPNGGPSCTLNITTAQPHVTQGTSQGGATQQVQPINVEDDDLTRRYKPTDATFSGHNTNDCYQLKKQIKYYVKTGKLAHLVRDIKQGPPPNKEDADKGAGKKQRELNMVYADKGNGVKRSFSTLEPWMLATMTVEPRVEDLHLTTDPLIILAAVGDYNMRRILLDSGSSEDILYEHCFNRMQPRDKKILKSVHSPIKGFTGEKVDPIGQITFLVTFGLAPRERTILLTFLVVRAESYHNVIIGRFTLGKRDAVVSTARGFMKFPTPRGIATVFWDKIGEVLDTKRCRQGPTCTIGPER
ncbi:uncharacterized protein LOC110897279 [Helianthus annuus]|uniref:uncharacterized protein LOC110897279 n=1 Tax=Helianthus annuus TaxID=4232 RepID=UPI000B8FB11E|nr:uncharacterized protein LOC110897279 [Helianthus annuus]